MASLKTLLTSPSKRRVGRVESFLGANRYRLEAGGKKMVARSRIGGLSIGDSVLIEHTSIGAIITMRTGATDNETPTLITITP